MKRLFWVLIQTPLGIHSSRQLTDAGDADVEDFANWINKVIADFTEKDGMCVMLNCGII